MTPIEPTIGQGQDFITEKLQLELPGWKPYEVQFGSEGVFVFGAVPSRKRDGSLKRPPRTASTWRLVKIDLEELIKWLQNKESASGICANCRGRGARIAEDSQPAVCSRCGGTGKINTEEICASP